MSAAAISLRQVALGWHGRSIVSGLSGDFAHGSLTAVVGANGSGKSTLLKTVMGLLPPLAGSVRHAVPCSRACAWLPQGAEVDRSFPLRVIDMVAMGAWQRVGAWGALSRREWDRAHEALDAVGLAGMGERTLDALSGGQFQRALFARLLLQDAAVFLLDEPFAAVDLETTQVLMDLVGRWHADGRTVIAVLHDLGMVRSHFPSALLLAGANAAWGPTAEVLTDSNLARARGRPAEEWL